jgi:hypothetical protein
LSYREPLPLLSLDDLREMVIPLLTERFYGEPLDSQLLVGIRMEVKNILAHLAQVGFYFTLPESPMPIPLLELDARVGFLDDNVEVVFIWQPRTDYIHVDLKLPNDLD